MTPTHQTVVVNPHLPALLQERLAPWRAGQYLRLANSHVVSSSYFALPHISPPVCAHRYSSPDYTCRSPTAASAKPDKTSNSQPILGTALTSGSKPKGMQLGGHKTSVPGTLLGELAAEVRWGGDVMDINADADDWSTCSSLLSKTTTNYLLLPHAQMNLRAHWQGELAATCVGPYCGARVSA